jgi:membrane dipeptidase
MQANPPRRQFLIAAGAFAVAPLLSGRVLRAADAPGLAATPDWHGYREAIVIDALGGPGTYADDTSKPLDAVALDHVRASGITAVNLTVSGVGSYERNYDETIHNIAWWNGQVAAHPDRLLVVHSGVDIDEAKRSGRLGLIYGFQDATPLGEDLERVEMFHQLGVRVFQLTYNRRNLVGDGCLEPGNAGLSGFGRSLVEHLNARRALIDLSHAGERTTLEAIDASKVPIAISHTGCAALAANPRNKTDNELKRLADKGGVVGIFLMPFLRSRGQPMAEDLIRHLEHAVDVCGEDHVGIGSDGVISPVDASPDFKRKFAAEIGKRRSLGISAPGEQPDVYTFIPDLNATDRFARIAALLARKGHSDARIAKLIGGNFNRLFRETWGASA